VGLFVYKLLIRALYVTVLTAISYFKKKKLCVGFVLALGATLNFVNPLVQTYTFQARIIV